MGEVPERKCDRVKLVAAQLHGGQDSVRKLDQERGDVLKKEESNRENGCEFEKFLFLRNHSANLLRKPLHDHWERFERVMSSSHPQLRNCAFTGKSRRRVHSRLNST